MFETSNPSKTIEFWLKTEEVAQLLNITIRAVRKNCKEQRYKTRKVKSSRGSDGWEIALSSLPAEVIQKSSEQKQRAAVETRELKGLTERQKQEAWERFEVLQEWEKFAGERGVKPWMCVTEFLAELSDNKVCRATLFNWKAAYKKGLAALAPGKREKTGVSESTFAPEALVFLSDTYLTQNQLSIRECYKKLRKMAKYKGWKTGSYTTAKRYCNGIPPEVRELKRNGPKKFEDRVVPYIQRDPDSIRPMQLIECDHHQMDVAVRYHDGRVIFPWLTPWIDVRTTKPLGWVLSERPSSDSIALSFYKGALRYGIGEGAHLDNGKDFRAKIFTGEMIKEKDIRVEVNPIVKGVFETLGIKVHYAIPYNAKSKVIERFFGILEAEFSKWLRGYRGRNVINRPERLKEDIKNDNILSFEELKQALDEWLSFEFPANREMYGRYHEGKMPDEIFFAENWTRKMVREDELMLLISPRPKIKTVRQNGIWLEELRGWYWSEKVACNYYKQKVWCRVPPDDLGKIYVSDEQDRFIDVCERTSPMAWGEQDKEKWEMCGRRKKIARENAENKYKELVPNPMSDADREALVVDRQAMAKYKEPVLPAEYVTTHFREALDKEKIKKINEVVLKKRQKDLDQRLREMIKDEGPDKSQEMQKKADQYLRELYIEDIKLKQETEVKNGDY
jgi:hypothetical protein